MLPHRDRSHRAHIVGIVRDTVEVIAILAAGIWAFYVFIYQNQIVPSVTRPEVNFSATLQKVSVHDGLIGIRMDTDERNVGTVQAVFVAMATAVTGERIVPRSTPAPVKIENDLLYQAAYYRAMGSVSVFETGFVTELGDSRTKNGLPLFPGQDARNQVIFYVPTGRFDRLRVYIDARYTRDDSKTIPTQITVGKNGLPQMVGAKPASANEFATYVTSLDLNGP